MIVRIGCVAGVLVCGSAMGQSFPARALTGVFGYGEGEVSPWSGDAYPHAFTGDHDGDGVADVYVLSRDVASGEEDLGAVLEIFLGDGEGGFSGSVRPWGTVIPGLDHLVDEYWERSVHLADMDLDGRDDLVLSVYDEGLVVAVYLSDGVGYTRETIRREIEEIDEYLGGV